MSLGKTPSLVAFALTAVASVAQAETSSNSVFKLSGDDVSISVAAPLAGLIVSAFTSQDVLLLSFEYEHRFTASWTGYADPGLVVGTIFGRAFGGGSLALGARYYFGQDAPRGLWLGPEVAGSALGGLSAGAWIGSIGGYVGYNWLLARPVVVSPGVGVYLRAGTAGLGPTPALRLNIGWAL